MGAQRVRSVSVLARELHRVAVENNSDLRQKKLKQLAVDFLGRREALKSSLTVTEYEKYASRIEESMRVMGICNDPKGRGTAAEELAAVYDELGRRAGKEKDTPPCLARGGRSGDLVFSSKAVTNQRFMGMVKGELFYDPAVVVPQYSGPTPAGEAPSTRITCPEEPAAPRRYRVTVHKPGEDGNSAGNQLSTAFLQFLKERKCLELPSFREWCTVRELSEDDHSKRDYEQELAQAEKDFEEQEFKDLFGKARNLPMPGIQRGFRLLNLSIPMDTKEFRDTRIYNGPAAQAAAPDLDYEELVRHYVLNLKTVTRFVYDLEQLQGDAFREFLDSRKAVYDRKLQDRLVAAAQIAFQNAAFRRLVTSYTDTSGSVQSDGGGFGPPLEVVKDWLDTQAVETLQTAVFDAWGIAPEGDAAEKPETTTSLFEFWSGLTALCVPKSADFSIAPDLNWDAAGSFNYLLGINVPTEPDMIYQTVLGRANELIAAYDQLWQRARRKLGDDLLWTDRSQIPLSGYEMCAYIYVLLSYRLKAGVAGDPWNNGQKAADKLESGNISDLLINTQSIRPPWDKDQTGKFRLNEQGKRVLEEIYCSYRTVFDVLLSFMSANLPAAGSPVHDPAFEKQLYQEWIRLFVEYLGMHVGGQPTIPEDLLVLRLTPRIGRYGEVPQRSPAKRIWPRQESLLPPSHPARLTEAYDLELVPDRFLCHPKPQVYLREDYSLTIRHRGFGIGSNLYSLSVVPEETVEIEMKSMKGSSSVTSESTAENILEEAGEESASDFASEISSETQRERAKESKTDVSGKASANWGWGSAEVSTGYSAQSSSRDMAKNVSNVTDRLANKLSAKRQVNIENKREKTEEMETRDEATILRKFCNPNKGHVVTFHWYQMTRRLAMELNLDDIQFVYTSGQHRPVRVFFRDEVPLVGEDSQLNAKLSALASAMPPDVARLMPPNSAIVVVVEPYTEVVSMAGMNAFLARVFTPQKASEVGSVIWQILGYGPQAPEGLGVAAFCPNHSKPDGWKDFTELFSEKPEESKEQAEDRVVADRIILRPEDGADKESTLYLPNLDVRYKRIEGQPPARYMDERFSSCALPRLLLSKDQVINTNGVYCEAMLGQVSVLESYLQRHRDLDLLEKRIEVGTKELEFWWAAAKDNMKLVELKEDEEGKILAIVQEAAAGQGFAERKTLEKEKIDQEKKMADIETRRLEQQVKILEQQVEMLKAEIGQVGRPSTYSFDVPKNASVNVIAYLGKENEREVGSENIEVKARNGES